MIKRALPLVSAMHITSSVFINDDESGLHHDYEVWLEQLAPHPPIDRAGRGPVAQSHRRGRLSGTKRQGLPYASLADAHLKRNATRSVARDGPRRAAVIAVTNGRLDLGTWERIFYGEF